MTKELTQQISDMIVSLLKTDDKILEPDDPLVTSGRLNSLRIVELASKLESQYGLDFAKHGFNQYDFETLKNIVSLVQDLIKP